MGYIDRNTLQFRLQSGPGLAHLNVNELPEVVLLFSGTSLM
jgi:sugar diacid utilization regulator